jgi:hydrogenase 3 maturation protease
MGTNRRLKQQLDKLRNTKTLIVGIGNLLKGDDAAGPIVCQKLCDAGASAEIIDAGTAPENYIQAIIRKTPESLLVIDAIDFGASAGAIEVFRPEQLTSFIISTHSLSPHLFVDMICREIEIDVYFIGIQPAHTQLGQAVSSQVSQAIQELSDTILGIFPPHK